MKTLDLNETAQLLKMNPEALRRIAKRGDIPARKVGKKWIFLESALESWITGSYNGNGQLSKVNTMEVHSQWQHHHSSKCETGDSTQTLALKADQFGSHLRSKLLT